MAVRELRVDAALAGQRLDQALAALTPELGLRGRRRLIARRAVLVSGRAMPAAHRLRVGELVSLREATAEPAAVPRLAETPRLLARQGEYCFLYKPAGLHSTALAGGGGFSLERALPALLASLPGAGAAQLLQRLDYGTSGIVCAALTRQAALAFRRAEREGRCENAIWPCCAAFWPRRSSRGRLWIRQSVGRAARWRPRTTACAGRNFCPCMYGKTRQVCRRNWRRLQGRAMTRPGCPARLG